jgi:hypothetical protein
VSGTTRKTRARLQGQIPGWLRGKYGIVLGIVVAISGVSAVIGIAHLAWPWLLAAVCAVTAIATLATRAAEGLKKEKVPNLSAALAIACAIPVIAFFYHEWWDPSRGAPTSFQAVVNGSGSAEIFYPYNEPGGSQGYEYQAIPADTTITLSCSVSLPRSGLWFRIAGNGGWIPRDATHAIPGTSFLAPPRCT